MDKSELKQLRWEVNQGGTAAEHHTGHFKARGYGYGVKLIAISKMMDVAVVSTDFTDYPIVFQPWVITAADRGTSVDFCGVYQREPEDGEPDICVRRARWNEAVDRDQFKAAPDKLAYILSDQQVKIEATFGWLKECPSIKELAEEVEALVLAGCPVQRCRREAEQRSNLYVKVMSKTLPCVWDLTYGLEVLECERLEDWANRWLACAESLSFPSEFIPKHEIWISYTTTLFDRLGMV